MDPPLCLTRVDSLTTEAKIQWKGFSETLTKTLAHRALHKKMIQNPIFPNDLLSFPFKGYVDVCREI